jgi:hypothetical protein
MINNLPNIIYKYTDIDGAIKIISDNTLKYSNPNDFNDPFEFNEGLLSYEMTEKAVEAFIGMSSQKKNRPEKRKIIKDIRKYPNKYINTLKQTILESLSITFVCCFSEIYDNILMWSHYSDKHKGLCIGFDLNLLMDKDDMYERVRYTNDIIPMNLLEEQVKAIEHWALTKSSIWSYEKEIRNVIQNYSTNILRFNENCIKEIYFGCRFSEKEVNEFRIKYFDKLKHVQLYKIGIETGRFRLKRSIFNPSN